MAARPRGLGPQRRGRRHGPEAPQRRRAGILPVPQHRRVGRRPPAAVPRRLLRRRRHVQHVRAPGRPAAGRPRDPAGAQARRPADPAHRLPPAGPRAAVPLLQRDRVRGPQVVRGVRRPRLPGGGQLQPRLHPRLADGRGRRGGDPAPRPRGRRAAGGPHGRRVRPRVDRRLVPAGGAVGRGPATPAGGGPSSPTAGHGRATPRSGNTPNARSTGPPPPPTNHPR